MLYYNSIENKAIINKYDKKSGYYQSMYDLMSESVYPLYNHLQDWDNWYQNARLIIVKKEYIARPDLISLAVYGTDEYADIICKINGIQNPFELMEDMTLICPSRTSVDEMINKTSQRSAGFISSDDFETDNIANVDRGNKKLLNERRSPAEATVNDFNYIINKDMGIVFY